MDSSDVGALVGEILRPLDLDSKLPNGSMKTTIDIPEDELRDAMRSDRGRASGVTVPLADLLIFACAKIHGLDIAHDDEHFDDLAKLEAS